MASQPVEIASIAAQHTMVIQIRDSIIEGAALAGLESRGLIRDLGQGKSQGEQIVEALRDDFKEGRLSVLDFEGKVKELAQLVGVMQPQSDADLIRSLEEQLSRFKIQREFPPPTPI